MPANPIRQKYEQILNKPYSQGLLNMIRTGEGTAGPEGYRTQFTGKLFDTSRGWRHPNEAISSGGYTSTAAGAYQFLTPTWNEAARTLGLTSMDPRSQDLAALYLADRRGALGILQQGGKLVDVADKLAPEWASIPTREGKSYYGQPVKSMSDLAKAYEQGKARVVGSPAVTTTTVQKPQVQPQLAGQADPALMNMAQQLVAPLVGSFLNRGSSPTSSFGNFLNMFGSMLR
jgi:lysozyme